MMASPQQTKKGQLRAGGSEFHPEVKSLDHRDIRLASSVPQWKNLLPDLSIGTLLYHETVALPFKSKRKQYNLLVLGGRLFDDDHSVRVKAVQSFQTREGKSPSWRRAPSFPDMNVAREDFGAVVVSDKLYVIGGEDTGDTYEVLNLDNIQAGWTLCWISDALPNPLYCKAVAVDNQYIFALSSSIEKTSFCSFDTQSSSWTQLKSCEYRGCGFCLTSLAVPGEGSYVIVTGGIANADDEYQVLRSVEAYNVQTQSWIRLPDLPDEGRYRGMPASLENRCILLAGGENNNARCISNVIAFDWEQKEWFEFSSLDVSRRSGSSSFIPAPVNNWIITGGIQDNGIPSESVSLDIAPGIGWAKERLLLLCFCGKAQRKGSEKVCPLQGLPSGICSNILKYLFVPFPHEVQCKGSIFAGMMQEAESSAYLGKRKDSFPPNNQVKKPRESSASN